MYLKQKQRAEVGYICLSDSFSVLLLCRDKADTSEGKMFVSLYPAFHLLFPLSLTLIFSKFVHEWSQSTLGVMKLFTNTYSERFLDFGSFLTRLLAVFSATHIHNACVGF